MNETIRAAAAVIIVIAVLIFIYKVLELLIGV